MDNIFTRQELLDLGFFNVGTKVLVSKDARLYAISGNIGNNVRIDAYAILTGHVELGENVHISPFCFLGGTGGCITMERDSGMSTHVSLFTKSDDYSRNILDKNGKLVGDVFIGRNSILGAGVKVLPNVKILENVSIGCNCIITKDIEAGANIVNRGIGLVNVFSRGKK